MSPDDQGTDLTTGLDEALALLDAGGLPAMAVDTRERVVRSLNTSLTLALGIDPTAVEDEGVHAIVAEEHHGLVESVLDAIAAGVNVGPTQITVRPPGTDRAQPSIWARIPGLPEALGPTVVMLCQPARVPVSEDPVDPLNPEGHAGFGRIPPYPRWQGRGPNR